MDENRKKINIGDIAQALGVSKTTVSRAISGKGRIGAETRERVLKYIQENNYRPNILARGLANSKTYNLALVLPYEFKKFEQPFFRESLSGVYDTAVKCDYDVIISIASEHDIEPVKRIIENGKADGCIIFQVNENDMLIPYLKENKVPFVVMGAVEDESILQVDNRQVLACEELTNMLILQGVKKIALLGGEMRNIANKQRYEGFRKAFARNDCNMDNSIIFMGLNNDVLVERATEDAIDIGVDCIMCMDDIICGKALEYIHERNINIPNDIKIASFYDSKFLKEYSTGITALSFDAVELGRVACSKLVDKLNGKAVEKKTEIGYQVVLRESTKAV